MSYKETMREYWRSAYFQIGIALMIMGMILYNMISMQMMSAPLDQMMYWINISTYVLVIPLVGSILCAYGYYKVIMTD